MSLSKRCFDESRAHVFGNMLQACSDDDYNRAKYCIEHMPQEDLNIQCENGNTALMFAVVEGNLNIALLLLKYGASVNIQNQNNNGSTALMLSIRNHKDNAMVSLLLDFGSHIDTVNNQGNTALILAAYYNRRHIVKELLNRKASVNIQNEEGDTALIMSASRTCQLSDANAILHQLLDANATVDIVSNEGNTAVGLAFEFNRVDSAIRIMRECPLLNHKAFLFLSKMRPSEKLGKLQAMVIGNLVPIVSLDRTLRLI